MSQRRATSNKLSHCPVVRHRRKVTYLRVTSAKVRAKKWNLVQVEPKKGNPRQIEPLPPYVSQRRRATSGKLSHFPYEPRKKGKQMQVESLSLLAKDEGHSQTS